MNTRLVATVSVLIFLCGVLCFASDEEAEILLADLSGLQLTLDGADHYYWLTPLKGRVVLNKQCVPIEEDCDHEVLVVWDERGQKLFERAPFLDIPDMSHGAIYDSTLAAPDRLIVSTFTGHDPWTNILAEYEVENSELIRVIPTGSVRCRNLVGDHEGTIWCLGTDLVKRSKDLDYDLVYRFDASGKLLGSSLPRSLFPEKTSPLTVLKRPDGYGGFLPGNGAVRLWLPAVDELITFDSEGRIVDRLVLPSVEHLIQARMVSAPDDEIYAILPSGTDAGDSDTWTHALYRLSPDDTSWVRLENTPANLPLRITLVGADEGGLILLDRRSLELLWYPYPTVAGMTEMADASTMGYDE